MTAIAFDTRFTNSAKLRSYFSICIFFKKLYKRQLNVVCLIFNCHAHFLIFLNTLKQTTTISHLSFAVNSLDIGEALYHSIGKLILSKLRQFLTFGQIHHSNYDNFSPLMLAAICFQRLRVILKHA